MSMTGIRALICALLCVVYPGWTGEMRGAQSADPAASTWPVLQDGKYSGSAFLIDARGYFLSASHVVGKRGLGGVERIRGLTTKDPLPPYQVFSVHVIADVCHELDVTGVCIDGADVTVLRADLASRDDREPLHPFVLDLSDNMARVFVDAIYYGYVPPAGVWLPKPVARVQAAQGTLSGRRDRGLYVSSEAGYRGASGGPLVARDTVRGVVSFLDATGRGRLADGDAIATYFTPAHEAVRALAMLPATPQVCAEVNGLRSGGPNYLVRRSLTPVEVLQLVTALPLRNRLLPRVAGCGDSLPSDACGSRRPACVDLFQRARWLGFLSKVVDELATHLLAEPAEQRALGTAAIVAANRMKDRDPESAVRLYGLATEQLTAFLDRAVEQDLHWVGPSVASAVAFELSTVSSHRGLADSSLTWAATSYLIDRRPAAAWGVGKFYYDSGEHGRAATYFADAYERGLRSPYVVNDFRNSIKVLGAPSDSGLSIQAFPNSELAATYEARAVELRRVVDGSVMASSLVDKFAKPPIP